MEGISRFMDALVISITIILAGWLALSPLNSNRTSNTEVSQWLKALEVECDPATLGNDYEWSQSTQPTERRRMELLKKLHASPNETAAAISHLSLNPQANDESAQMLTLASLNARETSSVLAVCRLMVWSGYPAVRICAARLLRDLQNPACEEWFTLALHDERVVMNDACGLEGDGRIYPVRLIAELALRDLKKS